MTRKRSTSLLLIGLFLWVTACTSYKQIGIGEVADHGKVRVTLASGERETLHDPWVEADSIKGHEHIETHAFQLDQVTGIEAVSTNEVATVFTVLGIAVGVLVIACAASSCWDTTYLEEGLFDDM